MQEIRAISLHQPWASFIAWKWKHCETRSWTTTYRGELLICAAKKQTRELEKYYNRIIMQVKPNTWNELPKFQNLPFGEVVAIVHLSECNLITIRPACQLERDTGDWTPGRYAWHLNNIRPLEKTIPIKGQQGLWIPSPEIYSSLICTNG
ncbi:MAG TPA: hypothetical protein VK203_06095 [Nostocaceae cyanobacterium]|nr:hypothetical protein [Nostocaceae cyanobacterium]